jgi:plastocyanin
MTDAARGSIVVAALAALLLAGCGGTSKSSGNSSSKTMSTASSAAPAPATSGGAIKIVSFKYMPATITVKAGSKIAVANRDTAEHTITADDNSFDAGTINPGENKILTVTKPGTFAYHCAFHAFMHGTIIVSR